MPEPVIIVDGGGGTAPWGGRQDVPLAVTTDGTRIYPGKPGVTRGRQDHRAILDLLAAFGIDNTEVVEVTIHSSVREVTTVDISRYVRSTDPSRIQTYEVSTRETTDDIGDAGADDATSGEAGP